MAIKLHRRTFLRGLGGVALALPLLEVMEPRHARASEPGAPPKRYVFMYGGISIGHTVDGVTKDAVVPSTIGAGYEQTLGLAPLFKFGVQNDVSVVSRLKVPWGPSDAVPPGGRSLQFHYLSVTPQISGTRAYESGAGTRTPKGSTSEQLVADAIAGDTPHSALVYRVQAASYVGDNSPDGSGGMISYRKDASGKVNAVPPVVSPRLAFESLFSGFKPSDPALAAEADFELRRRKSVLDLVRTSTETLLPKLGKADRARLQQHFDEIRALELRIAALDTAGGASCEPPTSPGNDPPIGAAIQGDTIEYSTSGGYSNEELRAEILCDLTAMAFACDLSRVASIQMTAWKCYMNMYPLTAHKMNMHELTHGGGVNGVAAGVAWLVKHYARLTSRLKELTDSDGSSLLDNSALVMMFEGGHGFDPSAGKPGAHSTENMIALIGGHAGGLKAGQHVVAKDAHPASVAVTAMNAVGASGGLGDIDADIPALRA